MKAQAEFINAIKTGEAEQVRVLLAEQPQLAQVRDDTGLSAVMLAVYHGQKDILEMLLDTSIELDIWEAATTGKGERVARLLEQNAALVNAYSADGFAPLGLAAFFGHKMVVELLLAKGADPNAASKNAMQVCPLHSAVAHRNTEVAFEMASLLLQHGAEVNVAQHGGWTPLHQAAAHGQDKVVRLLLSHGADPSAKSDDGRTALEMALQGGHGETAKFLKR